MGIHINPLGEISDADEPNRLISGSTISLAEFTTKLGREPTPSDCEREFKRRTRRALSRETDWLLYRRYEHLQDMFPEGSSLIRLVATNKNDRPKVWLSREFSTENLTLEEVRQILHPCGWDIDPSPFEDEEWDQWEATLTVTHLDDGEIFRRAYMLEQYLERLCDDKVEAPPLTDPSTIRIEPAWNKTVEVTEWRVHIPPRGPMDYQDGDTVHGDVLGSYGNTYWRTQEEAKEFVKRFLEEERRG